MPHRENPWKNTVNGSPMSLDEFEKLRKEFVDEFNTSSEHKESDYCPHCVAVEALRELLSKLKAVDPKISSVDFYGILGLGIDSLIQKEPDLSTKSECVEALQQGMEASAKAHVMGAMEDFFKFLTNPSGSNKP